MQIPAVVVTAILVVAILVVVVMPKGVEHYTSWWSWLDPINERTGQRTVFGTPPPAPPTAPTAPTAPTYNGRMYTVKDQRLSSQAALATAVLNLAYRPGARVTLSRVRSIGMTQYGDMGTTFTRVQIDGVYGKQRVLESLVFPGETLQTLADAIAPIKTVGATIVIKN